MQLFKCGQAELDYLKKKDKILGSAIDRIGTVEREVIPDPFAALVTYHCLPADIFKSRCNCPGQDAWIFYYLTTACAKYDRQQTGRLSLTPWK
jgi:hypothetical protein